MGMRKDEMGEYDVKDAPENLKLPFAVDEQKGTIVDANKQVVFIWEFPGLKNYFKRWILAKRRAHHLVCVLNSSDGLLIEQPEEKNSFIPQVFKRGPGRPRRA